MAIDLEKLSPAPWEATSNGLVVDSSGCRIADFGWDMDDTEAVSHAEFAALARNAFEVMVRRGWGVVRFGTGWAVALPDTELWENLRRMRDTCPFQVLIRADAWMKANVERKAGAP